MNEPLKTELSNMLDEKCPMASNCRFTDLVDQEINKLTDEIDMRLLEVVRKIHQADMQESLDSAVAVIADYVLIQHDGASFVQDDDDIMVIDGIMQSTIIPLIYDKLFEN